MVNDVIVTAELVISRLLNKDFSLIMELLIVLQEARCLSMSCI